MSGSPSVSHSTYSQTVRIPRPAPLEIKPTNLTKRVLRIALPIIAMCAVTVLPIAGYYLNLFGLNTTVILMGISAATSIVTRVLAHYASKKERQYKAIPYFKRLQHMLNGDSKMQNLPLKDFLKHMSYLLEYAEQTTPSYPRTYVEPPKDGQYNTSFENPYSTKSFMTDLGRKEPPQGRIGIINGMATTDKEVCVYAELISHLFDNHNVHIVYNATHGPVTDIRECAGGLMLNDATAPVWHLHKQWDDYFNDPDTPEDGVFTQVCHSQGAILTRIALEMYNKEHRDRIFVIAVAPGGYISQETTVNAFHHTCKLDPVIHLDYRGKQKAAFIFDLESPQYNNHTFCSPVNAAELCSIAARFKPILGISSESEDHSALSATDQSTE